MIQWKDNTEIYIIYNTWLFKKQWLSFLLTWSSIKGVICANLQFEELSSLDHMYWWFPPFFFPTEPEFVQVSAPSPKDWGEAKHIPIPKDCFEFLN